MLSNRVFIGLGSNLGDSDGNIDGALAWLAGHPDIELLRNTSTIRTPPWGLTQQPEFSNAVAEVRTVLPPLDLLAELKRGETLLGRTPGIRWGPRVIDMDILLYGNVCLSMDKLEIPHPRLTQRGFVVAQLLELEPGLCLPPLGTKLREFL
jgi:2-amino-4-hydroxy-6-hydroxymethyldihydropteridine diphosphokinase